MEPTAYIICENLVKIYKVADIEVVALQGLDFTVQAGEMVGVVGVSGSGKSTLLNVLGGLDRPSAGRVWIGGKDMLKMSRRALDHYRCMEVGFVWQQGPRNLIPFLSALENIEMPLLMSGEATRKTRTRAVELLDRVGLGDRRSHKLAELSGGEQQRVAIAVALANQPRLLLADEPTGEVDTTTAAKIYQIFRDLNASLGLTILIVSHDPQLAFQVDRVVAIRDGKVATEMVRQTTLQEQTNPDGKPHPGMQDSQSSEAFEELIVLDSAGRLQVPRELLERYQIQQRARLEMVEDGILIRRAGREEQTMKNAEADALPHLHPPGLISRMMNCISANRKKQ